MWNQIVAIDVSKRILGFDAKIAKFSRNAPIFVADTSSLSLSKDLADSVDAVLVSIYGQLDETTLEKFPKLRCIFVLGTSTKKIAMDFCKKNRIDVKNVSEYCDDETAEWVMLKALEFFRYQDPPRSVVGRNFGMIGVGAVGKKIIERAHAFQMEVFFNARSSYPELERNGARKFSKEEIFARCDVVSLQTPAHEPWLSRSILDSAKKDLCLINICMGRISRDFELEEFLEKRPDVRLIMDRVAGNSYADLKSRNIITKEAAYQTVDAEQRLVDKFMRNLAVSCAV